MAVYPILIFFTSTLFVFLSSSTALDTLSPNQRIKDGNTLVSDGETYELGFFSPRNSKNRYLGIWYKQIPTFTVVWVANRDTPINDTSGMFQVSTEGTLLVLSGNNTVIWSSNSTVSVIRNVNNPVVQLLDNGNLVVRGESNTEEDQEPIWQSFDYPGDTLLPGQKLGKNFVTGIQTNLTSWKSFDDPSIGWYKVFINTNGYPQTFELEREVPRSRFGPWNGEGFRGLPRENTNPIFSVEFVVDQKEISYTFNLMSSVLQRIILTWDGNHLQFGWINRTQEWVLYGNVVVDNCSQYGRCGPFGRCSTRTYPPCNCMEGFEPKVTEEWNNGDWTSGCQRKKAFDCGNTQDYGFQKISGVKFPDTQHSWYNVSISLRECEMACKRNCSCTAYASLNIRNGGSGCLLWFGGLMDIREYGDNQDLYIRMAASELAGKSNFKRKKLIILVVVLSVSSVALLLSAVAYACSKKKKNGRGYWTHTLNKDHTSADHVENLDELPFFSLHKIAKATNNFHIDNKIGEGGFGPVYKGVLKDGQVIAIKRLSETSQQGPDEFKNEVCCIAKLQHRNLVKLLGYCVDGNEKILIYEYMDNKSLDSFLFGLTQLSLMKQEV
ncbi:hypothetical protein L1887_38404 [Cichorium endivia]|nr:hypothetical protein L1887_38404 [Cichorium endivia]